MNDLIKNMKERVENNNKTTQIKDPEIITKIINNYNELQEENKPIIEGDFLQEGIFTKIGDSLTSRKINKLLKKSTPFQSQKDNVSNKLNVVADKLIEKLQQLRVDLQNAESSGDTERIEEIKERIQRLELDYARVTEKVNSNDEHKINKEINKEIKNQTKFNKVDAKMAKKNSKVVYKAEKKSLKKQKKLDKIKSKYIPL